MKTGPLDDAKRVYFTFASASPLLLLGSLRGGATVELAAIVITQAFDDPAATVALGMAYAPNLFLDPMPAPVVTYESLALTSVPTTGDVVVTIAPGASTQGAGYAVVRSY